MSGDDVREFFQDVGIILLWSVVAVIVSMAVFEILNRRFNLIREIEDENNIAAGVLGGAFVLGIYYTIAQIVVS